mgnify:CR=1 FL=1
MELYKGNCLELSDKIENGSVDLILTDPPYGTMNGLSYKEQDQCRGADGMDWDNEIKPNKLFKVANKLLRKNGKLILFSQEPYTNKLISNAISNLPFSYKMIWLKDNYGHALLANKAPLNYFEDIDPEKELVSKVLSIDPNKIEYLSDVEVSKYSLVLAQFLVYYKYQYNKVKGEQLRIKRLIDYTVFQLLTDDLIKKCRTKAEARQYLISSNSELYNLNDKLFELDNELVLTEGMDKSIQEMINVFKKEMTRREYELSVTRYERKNK